MSQALFPLSESFRYSQTVSSSIFPPCFRNILSKITVFLVTFCNFLLIIRHYIFLPLIFPFFTFFCQSCFAPRYFAQFYFNFAVLLVFFANIQNSLQMLLFAGVSRFWRLRLKIFLTIGLFVIYSYVNKGE